jgi:hypothetical protein
MWHGMTRGPSSASPKACFARSRRRLGREGGPSSPMVTGVPSRRTRSVKSRVALADRATSRLDETRSRWAASAIMPLQCPAALPGKTSALGALGVAARRDEAERRPRSRRAPEREQSQSGRHQPVSATPQLGGLDRPLLCGHLSRLATCCPPCPTAPARLIAAGFSIDTAGQMGDLLGDRRPCLRQAHGVADEHHPRRLVKHVAGTDLWRGYVEPDLGCWDAGGERLDRRGPFGSRLAPRGQRRAAPGFGQEGRCA